MNHKLSFLIIDLLELCEEVYTNELYSKIITYGEVLSTNILSMFLNYKGTSNVLIDAKEFMRVDTIEQPNIEKIQCRLYEILQNASSSNVYMYL